jgi:hypothetical protein
MKAMPKKAEMKINEEEFDESIEEDQSVGVMTAGVGMSIHLHIFVSLTHRNSTSFVFLILHLLKHFS